MKDMNRISFVVLSLFAFGGGDSISCFNDLNPFFYDIPLPVKGKAIHSVVIFIIGDQGFANLVDPYGHNILPGSYLKVIANLFPGQIVR